MKESTIIKIIKPYAIFIFFIFTYLVVGFTLVSCNVESHVTTAIANLIGIAIGIAGYIYLKRTGDVTRKVSDFKLSNLAYVIGFSLFTFYANISLATYVYLRLASTISNARSESAKETSFIVLILFSCILAPITEEIMMRLFSYNLLKRSSNWIVAACVTSFVFGALHGTYEHLISGFFFGITSVLIYELTGTIIASILYHMFYNFLATGLTEDMLILSSPSFEILMIIYLGVLVSTIILKQKNNQKNKG